MAAITALPSTPRIVANKAWAEKNPPAAKLFEVMQLPVADINAQNERMRRGENTQADIARHTRPAGSSSTSRRSTAGSRRRWRRRRSKLPLFCSKKSGYRFGSHFAVNGLFSWVLVSF
jgi:hypothetical protein